jgi:hypothetical protein
MSTSHECVCEAESRVRAKNRPGPRASLKPRFLGPEADLGRVGRLSDLRERPLERYSEKCYDRSYSSWAYFLPRPAALAAALTLVACTLRGTLFGGLA